jgi:hypothetical protein
VRESEEEMEKTQNFQDYMRELWLAFEKTGSIGAYLLYSDIKEKAEKARSVRDKKAEIEQ